MNRQPDSGQSATHLRTIPGDAERGADRPGQSEQVIGRGLTWYTMKDASAVTEKGSCRHCGTFIVRVTGSSKWFALQANWPNLAHCHYSASAIGESIGHEPEAA